MDGCEFEVDAKEECTRVKIRGAINEQCRLADVALGKGMVLHLDLNEVTYINSGGIRNWIKWLLRMKKAYPKMALHLENIPSVLLEQINTIEGFVPPYAEYLSFYVPYYCEDCDEYQDRLLQKDSEFTQSFSEDPPKVTLPEVKCPECKVDMEPDIFEETYFRFLESEASRSKSGGSQ